MIENVNSKKKSTTFLISASIICLLIIGFFLFISESSSNENKSINRMQNQIGQLQKMESDVKQKENEISQLTSSYKKSSSSDQILAINSSDFSPEERELLEKHILNEKDVSARSLLQEILQRKEEINQLKHEIAEIENQLPRPHITQKGESHYQIALTFLIEEKGVDKEHAMEMVGQTALFDELAEGFKVWNFYSGSEFGTSVTQGNAKVSPNTFVYRSKKRIIEARDHAITKNIQLTETLKCAEEKQEETEERLSQINRENQKLAYKVNDLTRKANSMFYRIGSRKNLKKEGILSSGFLSSTKIKDITHESFNQYLDLNMDNQLTISASELGIDKIKDVVLYPRFYKKNGSYKVLITSNKKHALLTLLNPEKFKSERVIIAVK